MVFYKVLKDEDDLVVIEKECKEVVAHFTKNEDRTIKSIEGFIENELKLNQDQDEVSSNKIEDNEISFEDALRGVISKELERLA